MGYRVHQRIYVYIIGTYVYVYETEERTREKSFREFGRLLRGAITRSCVSSRATRRGGRKLLQREFQSPRQPGRGRMSGKQ